MSRGLGCSCAVTASSVVASVASGPSPLVRLTPLGVARRRSRRRPSVVGSRGGRRWPRASAVLKTSQSLTEHVVGVELVGRMMLHPLTEVAERLPRRASSRRSSTSEHPRGRARRQCAGRALVSASSASLVRGVVRCPSSSTTRTLHSDRPVRRALSAARGAPSSWACAACSPRASGRAPRRHRATCGARIEPWRARPVPFWRHGFAPPPAHLGPGLRAAGSRRGRRRAGR